MEEEHDNQSSTSSESDDTQSTSGSRRLTKRQFWLATGIIVAVVAIGVGVKLSLEDYANKDAITGWLESIRDKRWAPAVLFAAIFIAGLVCFPMNLILIVAAAVLGPWIALGCGILGSYASALTGFGLGSWLGKPLVAKFKSAKVDRLNEILQQRGILSVMMTRLIPVPYVLINLVAGSSKLRFGVFSLGTILAIIPGMTAVVWLTRSVGSVISNPGWPTILGLVGAIVLVICGALLLRKTLRREKATRS